MEAWEEPCCPGAGRELGLLQEKEVVGGVLVTPTDCADSDDGRGQVSGACLESDKVSWAADSDP